MGASEEKRPSFWNSLGKNPKGDLPIQLTKVQTKEDWVLAKVPEDMPWLRVNPWPMTHGWWPRGGCRIWGHAGLAPVHVHSKGKGAQGAALSSMSQICLLPLWSRPSRLSCCFLLATGVWLHESWEQPVSTLAPLVQSSECGGPTTCSECWAVCLSSALRSSLFSCSHH